MANIRFGDVGTWVGSVGTVLAVLFAYWSGRRENGRSRARERRGQAESIGAWIAADKRPMPIKLSNSSREPVYDVIVSLVLVQGAGPQTGVESPWHDFFKVLPPGEFIINAKEYPGGGMHTRPGIELAFTDKSGTHWHKDKSGALTELSKSPDQYYGITQPIGWLHLDDDKQ